MKGYASLERAAALEVEGRFFEAAEAYDEALAPGRALENLTRLSASHPRYREACRRAVRLAEREDGGPSLAFENLLAAFVRSGPADEADADAFRSLSRLYERSGFPENAVEVLQKLVVARPEDGAAAARLDQLRQVPKELPALPELEPEPPAGAAAAAPATPSSGEDAGLAFRVGGLIAGRYRLDQRIGSGGMSVVFRATDMKVGDEIAIKVLTRGVFERASDERWRRELDLSRRIQHPNVVRVFDIGLAHGFRFMSMELLSGADLRSRMRGDPLPTVEGLDYLIQACAGLEAAHAVGIVHRDVKPENCFLTAGGGLKLMDFGLAKQQEAAGMSTTGILAGTPAYMAPEQILDFRKAGPAADLYSMGVMAFEIFTGRVPFDHPEPIPLMLMHTNDPPPPPRGRNPSISPELERIILDCLAKSPGGRPQGCAELKARLQAVRDRR